MPSYRTKKKSLQKKPFFANRAYTILGHGDNGHDTFTVPYNCVIIVKALSEDYMFRPEYSKYLQNMMRMDMEVLLNPLENMNALIENFDSVQVYYPDDVCPNFGYTLLNYSKKLAAPYTLNTIYPGSGIVDINKVQRYLRLHNTINNIGSYHNIEYNTLRDVYVQIQRQFIHSVYPKHTSDELRVIIDNCIDSYIATLSNNPEQYKHNLSNGTPASKQELIALSQYIFNQLIEMRILNTTQKTLCELYPGVYYNFVCRTRLSTREKLYNMTQLNQQGRYIKRDLTSAFKNNADVGRIIRQRISNTLPRKQYLRNYYTSKRYEQKRLSPHNRKINSYQRTEKEIQNLEQQQIELNARINNSENAYLTAIAGDEQIFALKEAQQKKKASYNKALKEKESLVRNLARVHKSPSATRKKRRASIH